MVAVSSGSVRTADKLTTGDHSCKISLLISAHLKKTILIRIRVVKALTQSLTSNLTSIKKPVHLANLVFKTVKILILIDKIAINLILSNSSRARNLKLAQIRMMCLIAWTLTKEIVNLC